MVAILQILFSSIFSLRRYCLLIAFSAIAGPLIANPANSLYFQINGGPTSTAIASSANPSCFGSAITLTATVTPATATGIVQFYDGAVLLGIGTLTGGIATFSTSILLGGSHSLTANYGGDFSNTTSTSPALVQSIDAATPATPGTITGATPVCPATTQTYSISAVANATVYNWSLPSGWSITNGAGTNSITVTTTTSPGNVSVTAANSCGTSAAQNKAVTTNPPIPAVPGPISGSISVCPSTSGNIYSIAAVPGATSYAWTAPGVGWTGSSTTTSITYATTAAAVGGNLSVAAVNGCGSSGASNTINLTPVNAPGNSGYTNGLTKTDDGITVANSLTPSERYGYLKFPLAALSVIPGGATITSTLKLTGNLSASSTNNLVNALGTNDPVITPAGTLFSAAPLGANYTIPSFWNTGVTNLTLKPQANLDIASSISSPGYIAMALLRPSTGSSVANFWGYSGGANVPVLAVTYASVRQLAITVLPPIPVAPGAISGGSAVCPNSAGNVFSIAAVTNATTYTWTVPAGWSITSGQGTTSITVTATLTGGNITVTAGNSCGTGPSSPAKAVTIGLLPTVSATPLSQESCSGTAIGTITLSNPNAVAGTTYSWTRDNLFTTGMPYLGTTTGSITGNLTNALTTQQTTSFTIYAISGIGCYSALPVVATVSINVNPNANAGADQSGCAATAVTIGGAPTASGGTPGYTYLWTTGVSNVNIANPTALPGTYTVTVTDSKGCKGSDAVTVSTSTGNKIWVGLGSTTTIGGDANFNNPANWNPAGVPGACNDVFINCDIYNIFNALSGALVISMNASAIIKSLSIDIGGTVAISSASYFKLFTGSSNTLNILNATTLYTHTSSFFAPAVGCFMSVGPGGVITYGGSLTTISSNNCLNYPFYADINSTGKMYLYGNAVLAGIGNDPANKPGIIVFNGIGTQTITNNSGSQPIFLASDQTQIGETNSPTVVLAGSGSNGFRNIGDLYINNASTLDIGTTQSMNRNSAGGSINMAAGTFMKLGRITGGVGSSNFPSNFSTFNFNPTSTVNYNAVGNQTIFATPLYGNLTFSNSGTRTGAANITVQRNIDIQGSTIFANGANTITLGGNWTNYGQVGFNEQTSMVDFNGTGAQAISTIGGEIFHGLRKTAAGVTTMLSDVAVQGTSPSFTLSSGTFDAGTFSFNSAAGTFNISNGLLKLARVGATQLPEFAITPYNVIGGTIELYGNGNQLLRGSRAYRNLTFSTSGIKTVSSAITSITGTILTQNSVTLDVTNNTMGGPGTNLTMTGTSLYKTAGVGTKPDAQGVYTLGSGTTVEFTNSAATTEDIRLTAPTYYNVVVSGNNVANPSAGTGIKFQAGGNFTVKNTGLFKLGNATGFSGGAATAIVSTNNPSITLEDGSTIEYYGGVAGTTAQTITNVIPYYSLNFSGASVKTAPAGILTVRGNLSNNSSGFAHNNGTVLLNGTVAQNYSSAGTLLNYSNFTATNSINVNINGDLAVSNILSLGASGKLNLATGNITMKSTSTGTAAIDKINVSNSIGYAGAGRFIVERYIPTGTNHGKTWQFLSTPAFGQSVNATWQEGNAFLVPGVSGLGTTISSELPNAQMRGYDFETPSGPSIKTFNSTTGNWVGIDDGITSTTSIPLANPKGYMIFVRGDRTVQSSSTAANPTTLRSKGKLYSPGTDAPSPVLVAAGKFGSVGNPYASAIDFTSLLTSSTGLDSKYYVWDPLLTGSQGLGGYQVFSSVTGWVPTPGGTTNYPTSVPYSKIQSGQAFFVYSTPGGTVNFNENNKITGSQMVYRQQNLDQRPLFRTSLYSESGYNADGNTVAFDPSFTNDFDDQDALKLQNASENLAISNNGKLLAIDARGSLADNDTIFYNATRLRAQPYVFKFWPVNMQLSGFNAFLVDKFSNTSTQLSLSDSSIIPVTVSAEPGSASPDRFFVVFKAIAPTPVTFINIDAKRNADQSVSVNWKAANEINLAAYELERSKDGLNFFKINNNVPALNNGVPAAYTMKDEHPFATENYYRIKAIGNGNYINYSSIAKVKGLEITSNGISVYPNPVPDNILHIHFENQEAGLYNLSIVNIGGQVLYNKGIVINGNQVKDLPILKTMSAGSYQLKITGPGVQNHIIQLVIK